jgi:F0F1-type ATP synthase assembly protein I
MARGFEIVLTPLLMGGLGYLLDGWFGTGPILAVVFFVLGVIGIFTKLKVGYDRQFAEAEVGKPWTRGTTGPAIPPGPGPEDGAP